MGQTARVNFTLSPADYICIRSETPFGSDTRLCYLIFTFGTKGARRGLGFCSAPFATQRPAVSPMDAGASGKLRNADLQPDRS